MRTSLELPDDLFREAKAAAARRGIPLKLLLQAAVENELARKKSSGYRVKAPLVRCKSKKPIGLTNAEIEDLLA
jgi:hypothetical protein